MTSVQIIDGERYVLTTDGEKRDLTPNAQEELRNAVYVQWLWQLTPLLAPGVSLELRPATTYRDRPADCLVVRRDGCPDVTMWFDRESGLLVKLQRPGFGSTGAACTIEQTYGNFRTFSGVVRPTRTVVSQDGVVILESDVTEYQPLADVDSSEFTGP